MARVINALGGDRYNIRFNTARTNITVRGYQLISVPARVPDLISNEIQGRGILFYRDIDQAEIESLNRRGLIPVRYCAECRQFFRRFVDHFRYSHNRFLDGFGKNWEAPTPQKYGRRHLNRRPVSPPVPLRNIKRRLDSSPVSLQRSKRRKSVISIPKLVVKPEEDEEDEEDDIFDVNYWDNTFNKGFFEDDDLGGGGGGAVGGAPIANRPRIRVRTPAEINAGG